MSPDTNILKVDRARGRKCGFARRVFLPTATETLLSAFDAGKSFALARAVSIVENQRPGIDEILGPLQPRLGHARRMGIPGAPGAGKSTITNLVTRALRDQGLKV